MFIGEVRKKKGGISYYAQVYYVDYTGKRKRKTKRGFKTKREAKEWASEFIRVEKSDMDMYFGSFVESYWEDISVDLKQSTIDTKKHIIDLHITPFFKDRMVREINARDITKWQNEIKKKGYSDTYIRSIDAQMRAIFHHATKLYNLTNNPCDKVATMGKHKSGNMGIWSHDDFEGFIDRINDNTQFYYAYQILYWTGIRLGELMALTLGDIDFENKKLTINKSYRRRKGEDIITTPKTEAGIRTIYLPDFLVDELRDYVSQLYGIMKKDRLFTFSKGGIEKDFKNSIETANKTMNLTNIRIHDLRHSHASLLISQGENIAVISKRLGHNSIKVTLDTYCHLFEEEAQKVANNLDKLYGKKSDDEED